MLVYLLQKINIALAISAHCSSDVSLITSWLICAQIPAVPRMCQLSRCSKVLCYVFLLLYLIVSQVVFFFFFLTSSYVLGETNST